MFINKRTENSVVIYAHSRVICRIEKWMNVRDNHFPIGWISETSCWTKCCRKPLWNTLKTYIACYTCTYMCVVAFINLHGNEWPMAVRGRGYLREESLGQDTQGNLAVYLMVFILTLHSDTLVIIVLVFAFVWVFWIMHHRQKSSFVR